MPVHQGEGPAQCKLPIRISLAAVLIKNQVVLCGVFTALDSEGKHEVEAAKIMQRELGPLVNIVCSRDGTCASACEGSR